MVSRPANTDPRVGRREAQPYRPGREKESEGARMTAVAVSCMRRDELVVATPNYLGWPQVVEAKSRETAPLIR